MGLEVVDQNGNSGTVVGFEADKNLIIYSRPGYSTPSAVEPRTLAIRVESAAMPVGTVVLNSNDTLGKVLALYDNGQVSYLRDGYSSATLSPQSELAKLVPMINGFKAGMIVLDEYDRVGTVQAVFANGKIQYLRSGYSSPSFSSGKLTPQVSALGALKAGMVVIDEYDRLGKIINLYQDGRIEYLKAGYSSSSITKSTLATVTPSYQDFSSGIVVLDTYSRKGIVQRTFSDGRIEYLKDGYSSTAIVNAKELSPIAAKTSTGFASGMLAIDSYSRVGQVVSVFKNDQIEFLKESYSSTEFVRSLSRELQLSPLGYSKAINYASDEGKVGKPIHFFENSLVQTLSADGRKSVASKLFLEVASLGDLNPGEMILFPSLKSYPVAHVFENRTVVVSVTQMNQGSMPTLHQVSFILPATKDLQVTAQMWITVLQEMISLNGVEIFMPVGVKITDYPALRSKIFELLDHQSGMNTRTKNLIQSRLPESI